MSPIFLLGIIILVAVVGAIWLCSGYTLDRITHPEEWSDAGKSGERILYNTLIHDLKIPENQILRNVYIPIKKDETSEIDLECKNYGGNIYGDARRRRWVQYIGGKKSFFYNPIMQNKNHAKHLADFLGARVPIVPLVTTITRGKWKVSNCGKNDLILGLNCHFANIYNDMPESETMKRNFNRLYQKLKPLSRPGKETMEKHISQIQKL